MDQNPYAPPAADLTPASLDGELQGLWRRGKVLIMRRDVRLPDHCIKCNAETGYRLKRKLYWHHPALYFLLIFNILIYAIVAMVVRKTAVVHLGLCDRHRRRRLGFNLGGAAMVLLGTVSCVVGVRFDQPGFVIGAFASIVGIVLMLVAERLVTPARIDARYVWIKGIHKDLLAMLPTWQESCRK